MLTKASTPLYEGSSTSMLSTTSLLLTLKTIHGISNSFMDELFSLLLKELLPKGNRMLVTTYEALKIIKVLILSYDLIHACTNDYVFFQDALKFVQQCPKCSTDRFVEGSTRISMQGVSTLPFNPIVGMHV